MHYSPTNEKCPLPYSPFKSCTVPRPIGWLSTLSEDGIANLAPYSQWQNLTFDPPLVMFAANQLSSGKRINSAADDAAVAVHREEHVQALDASRPRHAAQSLPAAKHRAGAESRAAMPCPRRRDGQYATCRPRPLRRWLGRTLCCAPRRPRRA